MGLPTTVALVEALTGLPLLEEHRRSELGDQLAKSRAEPVEGVCRRLVECGAITPFQKAMLLEGRAADLLLGDYVLLEQLGEGGMGAVFKARHSLMNRVVALKVIRRERLNGPQAVARFQREIRAAALLSHPNIVMALDAAQVGDVHFLVMEYVPGVDLARLLGQRGKLPAGEACDYAYQTALGLQHAHENGMVHRDIKPANLLRADRGHVVKILDMGLARLAGEQMLVEADAGAGNDQLTGTGLAMGTPDYIAPEQIDDAHSVDIRADIYSLGCALFHLLAGRAPYWHHKGTQHKFAAHRGGTPQESLAGLRPDLPPALVLVVERMMSRDPHDRFATPGEAAAALLAFRTSAPAERDAAAKSASPTAATITANSETADAAPAMMPALQERLRIAEERLVRERAEASAKQLPVLRSMLNAYVDRGNVLAAHDVLTAILALDPGDNASRTLRHHLRSRLRIPLAVRSVRLVVGGLMRVAFFVAVVGGSAAGVIWLTTWLADDAGWFGHSAGYAIRALLGFLSGAMTVAPLGSYIGQRFLGGRTAHLQPLFGTVAVVIGIIGAASTVLFPWYGGLIAAGTSGLSLGLFQRASDNLTRERARALQTVTEECQAQRSAI